MTTRMYHVVPTSPRSVDALLVWIVLAFTGAGIAMWNDETLWLGPLWAGFIWVAAFAVLMVRLGRSEVWLDRAAAFAAVALLARTLGALAQWMLGDTDMTWTRALLVVSVWPLLAGLLVWAFSVLGREGVTPGAREQ